jgi:hypothetical protein
MLYQNNEHWHGEAAQALEAVALAVEEDSSEMLSDFPSLIPSILSDLLSRAAADSDFLSRAAAIASIRSVLDACPSKVLGDKILNRGGYTYTEIATIAAQNRDVKCKLIYYHMR